MLGRAPGVLIEFADPAPEIEPTRIDVPVLICVTERGPVGTPVRCPSWTRFTAVFGGFIPNGLGAYAAKAFYDNGGGPAWVVRVAAPERLTTTSGAQPVDRHSSVVADIAGLVPGAVATLRQDKLARAYLVVGVDTTSRKVTWDRTLHPHFDLTNAIDVATGAGTARAVLADASGTPALHVLAASPGTWGDRIEVVASPVRTASTEWRTDSPGSATATPVLSTVGFVVADYCRISQDVGGMVTEEFAVVAEVNPIRRVLTWSSPIPASIDLTKPFVIEARGYQLAVLEAGSVVETWPAISSQPGHPRFVAEVLRNSARVRAEVLGGQPAAARVRLIGGRDGTAAVTTADMIGDELLGNGVGLAAASDLDEPGLVLLPDLVAPATPPLMFVPESLNPCDPCRVAIELPNQVEARVVEAGASFEDEQIVAAQQAVIESCERHSERVVILDPPSSIRTFPRLRWWNARFTSSYAVTVAPWLTVIEPTDSRKTREVPASAHLAGLISACDTSVGPWLSPANRSLAWAYGAAWPLTDAEHAIANEESINLIRPLPGRGLVPMGARTLASDAQWRFVAVRRTMIWLRRTLRHHLSWVVFEPITPGLAALITAAIATLLTDVWEAGGLTGESAQESFFVTADTSAAARGELRLVVGVAIARPAEFVTVTVTRPGNRLELGEAPTMVLAGGA